jgi:hypothetical protein
MSDGIPHDRIEHGDVQFDDVQYFVSDVDELDVVPMADILFLRMSGNAAPVLRLVFERLAELVEHADASDGALGRMFPAAYKSRVDAAASTRERHLAAMRAEVSAAVRRILAAWDGADTFHLPRSDVDDWMTAAGAAQFMYVNRSGRRRPFSAGGREAVLTRRWLTYLRSRLANAVMPEMVGPDGRMWYPDSADRGAND